MANIFIKKCDIKPNPVTVGEAFQISVEIGDRLSVLADADGGLLWAPEGAMVLADHDGAFLVDDDGKMIESEE